MRLFDLITRTIMVILVLTSISCISCHKEAEKEETDYSLYQVNIKSSLNVRSEPIPNGKKIGSLSNNDKVNVVDINNGWAKIKYGSQYAYVSAQYLTLIKNELSNDSIQDKSVTKNHLQNLSRNKALII